jgi:hypothetical protein
MKLRFYLDTILVNEPIGTDNLITSITRFRDIKGLLVKQDVSVTFTGDAYDYMRSVYDSQGWQGVISAEIEYSIDDSSTWKKHYSGKLFIRDVEWDLKKKYARVPIVDNSWYARLNNNKSIKVSPFATTTKNGDSITAITVRRTKWINQTTGATVQDNAGPPVDSQVEGFYVNDFLTFLISYLTDNEIEYESTIFGSGGLFEYLQITTGRQFRNSMTSTLNYGSTPANTDFRDKFEGVDLETLLKNLTKIDDLSFIIDYSTQTPTFRIERESYFQDNTKILTCENVNELTEKIESSQLYSKLKIGSGKIIQYNVGWTGFEESFKLIGWNQEEYSMVYDCNLDNTLDLSLTFITSSNVIEDIFDNRWTAGDDYYDKDIILWNHPAGAIDTNYIKNWVTGSTYPGFYNYELTNERILNRYLGGIPISVQNAAVTGAASQFRALSTSDGTLTSFTGTVTIEPVNLHSTNLPGYNPNGTYSLATDRFTANENGIFPFWFYTPLGITFNAAGSVTVKIYARRYDSGSALLYESEIFSATYYSSFHHTLGVQLIKNIITSYAMYMNSTDYMRIAIELTDATVGTDPQYQIKSTTTWVCTKPVTPPTLATYEPDDYTAVRYEFTHPITDEQFRAVIENPKGYITFNLHGGEVLNGRIESFKMNHKTGKAQMTLNSTKKRIN